MYFAICFYIFRMVKVDPHFILESRHGIDEILLLKVGIKHQSVNQSTFWNHVKSASLYIVVYIHDLKYETSD
jgi:hypothetical protein